VKTRHLSTQSISVMIILILLSGCAPAVSPTPISTEVPATATLAPLSVAPATSAPEVISSYGPVSAEVCQILLEGASQALAGLTFKMEVGAPFNDYVSGETGIACTLSANTNGASISDPNDALAQLVESFVGWTVQPAYDAGGPTGAATAMTRDSGLILISIGWEPSADANCPTDQPISECPLTPEQKLYTVRIEAAQK
jgi:hypothetical protein